MNELLVFGIVAGAVLILYLISVYNHIVRLKNNIEKAFANIEVLLKQRYDEIPNVIATVKGYAAYEKDIMERVAAVRASYASARSVSDKAAASGMLNGVFGRFFALVENYPQLRANESFIALQRRITELEDSIADRREFYNDTVTIYNTEIEQFPYVFIAKPFGYRKRELFVNNDQFTPPSLVGRNKEENKQNSIKF